MGLRAQVGALTGNESGPSAGAGELAPPGHAGGRPATLYRFASSALEVTDPFAVLRPPSVRTPA